MQKILVTKEMLTTRKLETLYLNELSGYNATYVTGTIRTHDSATSGVNDEKRIKGMVERLGKKYGTDVMFDFLFYGDTRQRVSGFVYVGSEYASMQILDLSGVKTFSKFNNVWK